MMQWILAVLMVLLTSPLYAQVSVVAQAKARHPNLAGNREVTLQANKEIAAEVNGGIYKKTSGNNCGGYSCDIICFKDGHGYDVWSDWDNAANPSWNAVSNLTPSLCELQTVTPPPSNPPPSNPPPANDPTQAQILQELKDIHALLAVIAAQQGAQTTALVEAVSQLKAEVARGIKVRF